MQDGSRTRRLAPRGSALGAAAAVTLLAFAPGAATAKAPAGAAERWNGTVVSKNVERGRVLTAGRGGEVRTLRVAKASAARVRVGQRVKVRAERSADGTYDAQRVRSVGRARKTRVRGAVVERTRGRYLISAGGSVFSVRTRLARRARAAAAGGITAGDVVVADVVIARGALVGHTVRDVGDAEVIELEGLFLDLQDGMLSIAVERRGLVEVAVPADISIEAPAPGDEVELLAAIDADGRFTLVGFDLDDEDGFDYEVEDGEAEIEGTLTELTEASLTVRNAAGELTCAIPAGAAPTGFAAGDAVEMECTLLGGEFTLTELESETAEFELEEDDEDNDLEDEDRDN